MLNRSVQWHSPCFFSRWGLKGQIDQADLKKLNVFVSWTWFLVRLRHMAVQKTVSMRCQQVVKAGSIYFALVFGAGFVLGTIRVLWLVPAVGTRTAELLEMPAMLTVISLSARWVARHFTVPYTASSRLAMGGLGLLLILVVDFTVVLWIRGRSFSQYFEAFDPVAGTAYFVMLGVFAVMPLLVVRRASSERLGSVR
jgi:hypothetical protein